MIKPGRPRLDDSPGFRERFATISPRLSAGEISQGQAARELGISVRSLKRYVKRGEGGESTPAHPKLTHTPIPSENYTENDA
jgi:hypothetical protein